MSVLFTRRIPKVRESLIRGAIRLLTTRPPSPCLLLPMDDVGDYPGGKVANLNFYDLEMKKRVTVAERRVPESVHLSRTIGSSRGWVVRMNNEDLTVHVTNMLSPSAPESSHRVISLPPLMPLPRGLDPSEYTPVSELVRNASLSSSPDQEGCVVAIKFWGHCISLCRLSGDSSWSWTHINSLPKDYKASSVIYSKAASIFYLTPSTDSFRDPEAHEAHRRKLKTDRHKIYGRRDRHGSPLIVFFQQHWPLEPPEKLVEGWCGKRFLVETPYGDMYTLMWYMIKTGKKLVVSCDKESDVYLAETKRFELYSKQSWPKPYVGDIGDLCIFFGKNEPFCVPTRKYPGLKRNSIYFTEKDQICVYDIATHTILQFPHQEPLLTPFWLPPK
ncbi:unnamed protein product [Thlaspi arvense]|uniref:KIB1-4 beta-propeller domain-containing protein n=1 Tax=Thlaspi arvense TaxID=13288 RepID=A0AAU9S5X1_THLAR|nr:unnamed protein product [Thlaspi arvense]